MNWAGAFALVGSAWALMMCLPACLRYCAKMCETEFKQQELSFEETKWRFEKLDERPEA